MSVARLKLETSSTDFLKWIEYLNDEEIKPPTRTEQYLAQIAAEVRLLRYVTARVKKKVHLKDLFLLFRFKASSDKGVTPLTEEEIIAKKKEISERSRAKWFAAIGLDANGHYCR